MIERVEKIIAESGVASRRNCKELIKNGLVKVNGKVAKQGERADYEKDVIEVNGRVVKKETRVYIIINKPRGVISAAKDARKKSVVDLVDTKERIFPIGRLDLDTEGLMILTNDGDFANNVMHPRYNVKKTYQASLDRALSQHDLVRLEKGVFVEDRRVKIFDLKQMNREVILAIHEGRKHVVKNLFEAIGYKVVSLKRIAIGNLKLELKPGMYKFVSKDWLEKMIF